MATKTKKTRKATTGNKQAGSNITLPILYATPYLGLMGDVTLGWQLLWQASIASDRLADASGRDRAFYTGKIASARYFASNVLALVAAQVAAIKRGDKTPLELEEDGFSLT